MYFLRKIKSVFSAPVALNFYSFETNLSTPASVLMDGIVNFHGDILFFMLVICLFVFYVLFSALYHFFYYPEFKTKSYHTMKFTHNTKIEIFWTVFPVLILLCIAFPSLALLYGLEESTNYNMTVKVSGHQWYWNYEYTDFIQSDTKSKGFTFDSYLLPLAALDNEKMPFRLLEVDKRVCIPVNMCVRFLITSKDVLHSWCVPALGVKLDACPGRLNQTKLLVNRIGIFYGQCSEICGVNHAFMPIAVESVFLLTFFKWLSIK